MISEADLNRTLSKVQQKTSLPMTSQNLASYEVEKERKNRIIENGKFVKRQITDEEIFKEKDKYERQLPPENIIDDANDDYGGKSSLQNNSNTIQAKIRHLNRLGTMQNAEGIQSVKTLIKDIEDSEQTDDYGNEISESDDYKVVNTNTNNGQMSQNKANESGSKRRSRADRKKESQIVLSYDQKSSTIRGNKGEFTFRPVEDIKTRKGGYSDSRRPYTETMSRLHDYTKYGIKSSKGKFKHQESSKPRVTQKVTEVAYTNNVNDFPFQPKYKYKWRNLVNTTLRQKKLKQKKASAKKSNINGKVNHKK